MWPAPWVSTALASPSFDEMNCAKATMPPPPAMFVTLGLATMPSFCRDCATARATWSWPLPGPPGATISSLSIWAKPAVADIATAAAAASTLLKRRFLMSILRPLL